LRADAVLGLRFEYQVLGERNGMMMVAAYGTAVQLAKSDEEKEKDAAHAAEDQPIYFVSIGNAERGPFSLAQIRELVVTGRIEGSSTARIDGHEGTKAIADLLRMGT
jgi:hypothetical protein